MPGSLVAAVGNVGISQSRLFVCVCVFRRYVPVACCGSLFLSLSLSLSKEIRNEAHTHTHNTLSVPRSYVYVCVYVISRQS